MIKSKTKRLVCGVGINDADYAINKRVTLPHPKGRQIQKTEWQCPIYSVWTDMLKRCYSKKYLDKYPTYVGCKVCEDWLTFSSFKGWMESQDWEGKELDKDLLDPENKEYSPDKCKFVTKEVNYLFLCKRGLEKHNLLGVRTTQSGKYKASCKNGDEFIHSPPLLNEMDAHNEWKKFKIISIKRVIEKQTDHQVIEALQGRIKTLEISILGRTEIRWL